MIARLIQMDAAGADFESVVATLRERVAPAVRQLPGFRSDTFASDRATGRIVSFVVFESSQGVEAAENLFRRMRGNVEALGVRFSSVENLEVVASA